MKSVDCLPGCPHQKRCPHVVFEYETDRCAYFHKEFMDAQDCYRYYSFDREKPLLKATWGKSQHGDSGKTDAANDIITHGIPQDDGTRIDSGEIRWGYDTLLECGSIEHEAGTKWFYKQMVRFSSENTRVIYAPYQKNKYGHSRKEAIERKGALCWHVIDSIGTHITLFASDVTAYYVFQDDNFYCDRIPLAKKKVLYEGYGNSTLREMIHYISDTPPRSYIVYRRFYDRIWPLSQDEAERLPESIRRATSEYWLRSPGNFNDHAALVSEDGTFRSGYIGLEIGVRPACYFDCTAVLFVSAAESGKRSYGVGASAMRPVEAYDGNEWMVTLKDDGSFSEALNGHAGFTARLAEGFSVGAVTAGDSVMISYSGARSGENEYVSAMITDECGRILYYGHIAHDKEEDTVPVMIPANLPAGAYTLRLFAESVTGGIDYASNVIDIPIRVKERPAMCYETDILSTTAGTNYAETVWFANTSWRLIEYGESGKVTEKGKSGILTFFSAEELGYESSHMEYAVSDLRKAMDDLYDAVFSSGEQAAVIPRTLNGMAPDRNNCDIEVCSDKVLGDDVPDAALWPLSLKEAENLPSDGFRALGAPWKSTCIDDRWYLRSPFPAHAYVYPDRVLSAYDYYYCMWIEPDGTVPRFDSGGFSGYQGFLFRVLNDDGEWEEDRDFIDEQGYVCLGVRPAFYLNLNAVLFTSAASGGKVSDGIGVDALRAVGTHAGDEWKLTLKDGGTDGGHRGFAAARKDGDGVVQAGEQITISYTGAQTGENEYVSIILQEPDTRRILYYGNLVKTEGGSPDSQEGGVPLLIPANLPAGSYTLGIFAEQCNGDYATDYASDVVRIPITVSP